MATLDTQTLAPHLAAMRFNRDIAADLGVEAEELRAALVDLCIRNRVPRKIDLCRLAKLGMLQ